MPIGQGSALNRGHSPNPQPQGGKGWVGPCPMGIGPNPFRVTLKGFRVTLKGFRVTLKGFRVTLKGFRVTLKGFRVTLKGWGALGGDIKGIGPFLIRGGVVWGPYGDNPFISPPKAPKAPKPFRVTLKGLGQTL